MSWKVNIEIKSNQIIKCFQTSRDPEIQRLCVLCVCVSVCVCVCARGGVCVYVHVSSVSLFATPL